jgi:hypothetical protein
MKTADIPSKNIHQPLPARVNNPGLFQHRQLLGRFRQCFNGSGTSGVPGGQHIRVVFLPPRPLFRLATRTTVRMVPSVGFITAL